MDLRAVPASVSLHVSYSHSLSNHDRVGHYLHERGPLNRGEDASAIAQLLHGTARKTRHSRRLSLFVCVCRAALLRAQARHPNARVRRPNDLHLSLRGTKSRGKLL